MEYLFVLAYGVVGSVKYTMHSLTQRPCGKASLLETSKIIGGALRLSGSVQSLDPKVQENIKRNVYTLDEIIFKEEDFKLFKEEVGGSVNIIFSDAHHTGEGLRAEFDCYIEEALADDFILYYDDLQNPSMQKFFLEICQKYKEKDASISTALLAVNGWLGQHESPHINGIITSIDMPKIFPFVNYLG